MLKLYFVNGHCFKCFCLGYVHFSTHKFCLSHLLTKAQRLCETMAESSSQHEFKLSFHCRLELHALEGRICESSYPVFKL